MSKNSFYPEFDLSKVGVLPIEKRRSMATLEDILVKPESEPEALNDGLVEQIDACAKKVLSAREKGKSVMLIYGAHLIKNGATAVVNRLMERGWLTHLATNGAGSIHDWEFAWYGQSTECVRSNVKTGSFGTWDETGRYLMLSLLLGGMLRKGYGQSVGEMIANECLSFPDPEDLEEQIRKFPSSPETAGRVDLLWAMRRFSIPGGDMKIPHAWKEGSVFGQAVVNEVPLTVHPGIGYDIISTHPLYSGAAVGRAANVDFGRFCAALDNADDGVVLSVGSAIMGPQVFEKSMSCVNNVRLQKNQPVVNGHEIHVVDLQDGGNWDWDQGEPPKENPAYYLRFCKSYARMGGGMIYHCCDNLAFMHHLLLRLEALTQ